TTDLFTPLYSDLGSDIYQKLEESGEDKLTLTHLRMAGRDQNMVSISIMQKIKNPRSGTPLGYVIIDIFGDYFAEELSPLPTVQGRNTFLVDADGVIITDEIYKRYTGYNFFTELFTKMDGENGKLRYHESGNNYLVYYEKLPYSGYTLVQMIPESAMYGEKRSIGYAFGIILLLIAVFAATMSYALSERISTPLRQLSGLMKQAASGDLSARFDLSCDDEIGEIGDSFNTMLAKMDELIGELFTKQYMLKVAQLNNLKQQINPHFLYNTLETIKWMTKLGNTDAIHSTVVALGAILRYSLGGDKEMVTLGEELEQTYNYLMIQRLRHGQRFDMRIEIPEPLHSCNIPKFLLQPLVENAIVHGLEPKVGNGELIISGYREGDDVHLRVSDNGVGPEAPGEKGHGIGLSNVRQRMALHYGERYGVFLTRQGEITCAEVLLPWREDKTKDGDDR
ncbi:MAG: sensor histidine kinase, partial [Angelakisella sp.]